MTRSIDADERGRRRYRRALGEAPACWDDAAAARFIAAALAVFPGSVDDRDGEPLPLEQLELSA